MFQQIKDYKKYILNERFIQKHNLYYFMSDKKEKINDEKEEIIYCEWCGEFPYYISIYEDNDYSKETLICKKCYQDKIEEDEMP